MRRPTPSRLSRLLPVVLLIAAGLLLGSMAFAEVSVAIQDKGRYIKFFNSSEILVDQPQVWGRVYSNWTRLNEWGDLYGDLPPAYVRIPQLNDTPFVVWPFMTPDGDYDLAFAWFNPGTLRWTRTMLIDPEPNTTNEIHPQMVLGPDGAIYLAWESLGAMSSVYFSRYRDGAWEEPILLSNADWWGTLLDLKVVGENIQITIEEKEIIRLGPVFRVGKVVVKTYNFGTSPISPK